MKLTIAPKTKIGKIGLFLNIIFIILIALKVRSLISLPINTFIIAGIGLVGFIFAIGALIKKDLSAGVIISIVVGLLIVLVIAVNLFSSLGWFKDFKVKETLTETEAGELTADTSNLGVISESEGYIYYVYEGYLYKIKADWTGKTKIYDGNVNLINVSDEWIFFTNNTNSDLCKIKADGTGLYVVVSDKIESFFVKDEWIFYKVIGGGKDPSNISASLYKIKTNGTGRFKIADISFDQPSPKIIGDWIYYLFDSDLYKIKADGTEKTLVSKNAGMEYVSGDWIYYTVRTDEGKGLEKISLLKIKTDGSERTEIVTLNGVYIATFDNEWLYYTAGQGLSRVRLDGTGNEKLNDISIWGLMGISGNWMYINDYGGPMFRVRLDGAFGTRIK